jgi:hypothetical protein
MPTVGDYFELLGKLIFKGEDPPGWVKDRVAELSTSVQDISSEDKGPEFDHLLNEDNGVELTARDAKIYFELQHIQENLPEYIREARKHKTPD